ncbi:hypothetical protein GCM10009678_01710 [Actinomadura kijaniata]
MTVNRTVAPRRTFTRPLAVLTFPLATVTVTLVTFCWPAGAGAGAEEAPVVAGDGAADVDESVVGSPQAAAVPRSPTVTTAVRALFSRTVSPLSSRWCLMPQNVTLDDDTLVADILRPGSVCTPFRRL